MEWKKKIICSNCFSNLKIHFNSALVQVIVLLSILFVFIYPFVLTTIADLRAIELKLLFKQSIGYPTLVDATGILAKYKLWEKRSRQKIEQSDDYLSEIKLLSLINNDINSKPYVSLSFPYFKKIAFLFINTLNTIVGDSFSFELEDSIKWKILELAYYEERKRKFHSAAAIYSLAVTHFKSENDILSNIYLHRGFCRSMINQTNGAKVDYEKVIKINRDNDLAITADLLIVLLSKKNEKNKKIKKMSNSLAKAILLYRNFSFYKSLNILLSLKIKRQQDYFFYRGRAYEEIGLSDKAIRDYKKVISMNSKTDFSKNANRRLYILGIFYNKNANLKKLAEQNFKKSKDKLFANKIKVLKKNLPQNKDVRKYTETVNLLKNKIVRSKIKLLEEEKKIEQNQRELKKKKKEFNKKVENSIENEAKEENTIIQTKNNTKFVFLDQIDTKEGNRFIGKIVSINEYKIKIKTSVGLISISSDSIIKFSMRKADKKIE